MDTLFIFIPFVLMLLSLGVVAGFLAGLLGVGGGIVLVPGLFYILSLAQEQMGFDPSHIMHICVGTSLAIIVPTGFSSARAHHKRGAVDFGLVRRIGAGIVLGVIFATYVANGLEGATLKMIFASALPVFAALMIIGKKKFENTDEKAKPTEIQNRIAGVVIGLLSSLIGIGGATLSVPYMSMNGVPMHRAVGTASALGLVISIPASIGFMVIGYGQMNLPPFSIGYVNIMAWACVIPVSVLIAPLGARVAHQIQVRPLRIGFAVFMVLVALNMWRKILMG
jgi:uncharacterized membrane protein YfcA